MSGFARDIRVALRGFARQPLFTAAAVIMLALAIGATTTVFTIVDAVVFELPFADPGRIVALRERHRETGRSRAVPRDRFDAWATAADVLAASAAYSISQPVLRTPSGAERLSAELVTADMFDVLGVPPHLGRSFRGDETEAGGPPVAIISHGLWLRVFAGRPDGVGKTLELDNVSTEVIGVMPPGFEGPRSRRRVELWLPLRSGSVQPAPATVMIYARLRRDVSLAAAEARLDGISRTLPGGTDWKPWVERIADDPILSETLDRLRLVAGAVLLVLIIACANVSGLLLGRNVARSRELAIRMAIGAGRWHVVRQLLVESLLLTLAGSALGMALAGWSISVLASLLPGWVPRISQMDVDGSVMLFAAGCAVVCGVAIALLPALAVSRGGVAETLKAGSSPGSRTAARRRSLLIVVESALAIVVLTAALLLIRGFLHLNPTNPGFALDDRLTVSLRFNGTRYETGTEQAAFVKSLAERLRAVAGVREVTGASSVPLTGSVAVLPFRVAGDPSFTAPVDVYFHAVLPRYLTDLEIPLLQGRDVDERDTASGEPVAVVSDAFVRRYLAGRHPLGVSIEIEEPGGRRVVRRIAGVTGDIRLFGGDVRARPMVFVPYDQSPLPFMRLIVRGRPSSTDLPAVVRREVAVLDPSMPIDDIETLRSIAEYSVSAPRFLAFVLGAFAATAVVLAWLGVYAMAAWSVSQRARELAVRVALGARPGDIRRLVLRYGLGVGLAGAALGTAGAHFAVRLIESWLAGLPPREPLWQAALAVTFVALTTLATYVPARRAAQVDANQILKG